MARFDAIGGLLGLDARPGPRRRLRLGPPAAAAGHNVARTQATRAAPTWPGAGESPYGVRDLPALAPRETPPQTQVIAEPLKLQAPVPGVRPKSVPLLSPLAARFIVAELVASSRFGPDPDLGRLVDGLARCEIPQPVPLQEHRTLALGVQVLVDDGEGMEPFADDQQGMLDLVRRLAGEALVDAAADS